MKPRAIFPDMIILVVYRKYKWYNKLVLAKETVKSKVGSMITPDERITITKGLALYKETLTGNNYSPESLRAYMSDLEQFFNWIKGRRVDWETPHRIQRIDIVEFINFLGAKKLSGETRKRKLASIRSFLQFLKQNKFIYGNPAETITGPLREEKEPSILQKVEYKALLQATSGNKRDYAIVMLFLQTGMRVSELVKLTINDLELDNTQNPQLIVRAGKGKKDRMIPLEPQGINALKEYLKIRDSIAFPETTTVFVARNGTSMDQRTVRYAIKKYYKEAGIKKKASVHTLRHTFGTYKIHNGMKLPSLKEILGHRNMQTTYKYVHLDRTNLREEMEQTALR